jgi:hypothetical protein
MGATVICAEESIMQRCIARKIALAALLLGLAAPPALGQEREWTFDTGEDDAYLVFGVPETDDVGVSFWCSIGVGTIRIFLPEAGNALAAGKNIKLDVRINGKTFSLDGDTAPNEESGATSVEAQIATTDPFFAALPAADRFSVKIGKEESVFPLEGADFDSLLRVCAHH